MARRDPLSAIRLYLVAVDGSEASSNALAVTCDVARRSRARVTALYTIEVPRSLPLDADLAADLQQGEAVLTTAERTAADHDVRLEGRLLQARQAGAALVEEAAALGADAIVLGLAYHRPYGRFELGPLAEHVLEQARCQVWLIRYPPAPEAAS